MAQVASVYTIDPCVRSAEDVVGELNRVRLVKAQRPRPENKRVWASIQHGPEEILKQAFEEAIRRDPQKEKTWVGVVDGNEKQLHTLLKLAACHNIMVVIILDFIHVAQYVWKAAHLFHERGRKEAQEWVRERLAEILRGHSSHVAAGMRRSATLRGFSQKKRGPVDDCADYLLKYANYLKYDQYLAAGLPIASGVIEGACRYLVEDRMGITGAVWGMESAEAVLKLRSLQASHDFEEYWRFHEQQEFQRHHASSYKGAVSAVQRPSRAPLSNRAARPRLRLCSSS
jgi:hypothetical protein